MNHLVKAMTVAGIFAAGLPLLTEAASAQTLNAWNHFTSQTCWTIFSSLADGSVSTMLYIWTGSYYVIVPDSAITGALYKSCTDGSGAYGWYAGPIGFWTQFYTSPGLK